MIWGKKKKQVSRNSTCLLLDSQSVPIARGEMIGPPAEHSIRIRLTDGDIEEIAGKETIQVVPSDENAPIRMCKFVQRRNDDLELEPVQTMGAGARENLRIAVNFQSYVYPQSGGQVPILAHDLSCGGIAFYTAYPFADREQLEIVIPNTQPGPLLLNAEVIRHEPYQGPINLYAAKFVDVINDEEFLVREAVFNLQLQSR